MNNFLSELRVDYIDGKRWRLVEPFTYHLGSPDGPEYIECPVGMITDFASSPRLVKLIWPSPGGPWDKPALSHDRLYQNPIVSGIDGTTRMLNREECDRVFDDAMIVTETPTAARLAHYNGVRLGGWWAWRKYRKQEAGHGDDSA